MILPKTVFESRLKICRECPHWKGACVFGHSLDSPPGCPLEKFPGYPEDSNYLKLEPKTVPTLPATSKPCCGSDGTLKPLTWLEVWNHFIQSLRAWKVSGFKMVSDSMYKERLKICQQCPKNQYQWYQCRHCRCIIYTKAKLATETCPFNLWPKIEEN